MILNLFFKMSMGEFGEAVSSFIGDTNNPGLISVLKIMSILLVVSSVTRGIFWFGFNKNWTAILTVVGIGGVLSAVFYLVVVELPPTETPQYVISMAANSHSNIESYNGQGKTAFVVGYTGETGKELVKELSRSKIFDKVTLIGRRKVEYDQELLKGFNVEQKVVDFEKLEESANVFQGHDVGFSCLGTTRSKAGVEGFKRVDRDYVLETAQLARRGGTNHFHLVTAQGANPNSSTLYFQIKGEVEEKTKSMKFDRLTIYKPGLLLCNREESRTMEWMLQKLLKPLEYFAPGLGTTPTSTLARALVHVTVAPKHEAVEILDGKDIHKLGNPQS